MSAHRLRNDMANADWQILDPGDGEKIPVALSGVVELVSAGSETRLLLPPTHLGQRLTLAFKTDGGDIVVTTSPNTTTLNVTGDNTITFDTAGEMIELVAIYSGANLRWRALACLPEADTASLSTV